MVDPFFDRTPTKWNINDFTRNFLQNASEHPTYNSLTAAWTYSIDAISRDITLPKGRRDKAKFLREMWDIVRVLNSFKLREYCEWRDQGFSGHSKSSVAEPIYRGWGLG